MEVACRERLDKWPARKTRPQEVGNFGLLQFGLRHPAFQGQSVFDIYSHGFTLSNVSLTT